MHRVFVVRRGKRTGKEETKMSAKETKAISNRVAQAISEGDLDALDDLMAPELAEEFKRDVTEIRRAFPDYAGTNVEQITEGVVRDRSRFTGPVGSARVERRTLFDRLRVR